MPRAADRVHGFTTLPLRCPHCTRRMKQSRYILHGVVLECAGCRRLQYVLLVQPVQMAYVCSITAQEAIELAARGASPVEVVRSLGIVVRAA